MLDVVMHEVADTAMATSTALAVVIDGRLLPVLIVDRTPKQFGAQLRSAALTVSAGVEKPDIQRQTLPKVAGNAAEPGRRQRPAAQREPRRAAPPERSLCRPMHQRAGLGSVLV